MGTYKVHKKVHSGSYARTMALFLLLYATPLAKAGCYNACLEFLPNHLLTFLAEYASYRIKLIR